MLKKEVSVSFIVAIYNKKDYIRECLDSLLSQAINKEIICVDDCSTDGTYDILIEYKRKYKEITIIRNNENLGLIKTRLVGIKNAKGNYAMLVDADDSLISNVIPKIYQVAIDNSADIIEFGYYTIYDDVTKLLKLDNKVFDKCLYELYIDGVIINNLWNKLYSKKVYKSVIKFIDFNIKFDDYSDPVLFLYTFLKYAKIVVHTDLIAYNYYKNRTGMTTIDSNLKHFYHYCNFDVTYKFLKNTFGVNVYIESLRNLLCNQAVDMYLRLKPEDQNEHNKLCMKKMMTNREIEYLIECHKNK